MRLHVLRRLILALLISLGFYYSASSVTAANVDETSETTDAAAAAAVSLLFEGVRRNDEAMIMEALLGGGQETKKHSGSQMNTIINTIGPNTGGQTALMHAVLTGKETAVRVLLDLGADASIPEKDGYTPMHGAGFQGRASIAKMLMEDGLNPSHVHKRDGYTPIHRACWGREARHAETVQVLLELGHVSPLEPSRDGKVPLDMTTNPATIQVLQDWMAKLEKEETETADEGSDTINTAEL
jgi:hypothetical protein